MSAGHPIVWAAACYGRSAHGHVTGLATGPRICAVACEAPVPNKLMVLKDALLIVELRFSESDVEHMRRQLLNPASRFLVGDVAMHPPSRRSAAEQLQSWRILGRVRAHEDSRLHPRRKVNIAAKIMVDGSTRDCTLLDISDSGARIALESMQELPDEFQICMTPSGFPFRQCKLIWRSNSEIGVEFKSVHPWWV